MIAGLPVSDEEETFANGEVEHAVIAIGEPGLRRRIAERLESHSIDCPVLIHPKTLQSRDSVVIGAGSIICAGTILTVDIRVGRHVHLNLDCTVGHDAVIQDYVTMSPGVHISGNVTIGAGAFLGTGSCVLENLNIGEGAVVGGAALVNRDVPPNVTVVGVPAGARDTSPR